MQANMNKVIRLGTLPRVGSVYCRIEYRNGRLSITGVEGPQPNGNARGGCGQIVMSLRAEDITPAPGWTRELIAAFLATWDKWHLNNMQAGTPAQTAWVNAHASEFPGYPVSHYEWASKALAAVGLNPDGGYRYGSAWLTIEVPASVLAFLASLPDADTQPPWV